MAIIQTQQGLVAPKRSEGGFALLIAVIFMSVMLTFGLALSSLGYKQSVLASAAIDSQYAFYTANAALECALFADQQEGRYAYPPTQPTGVLNPHPLDCRSSAAPVSETYTWTTTQWSVTTRTNYDGGIHCADVTVYKYKDPDPITHISTYIYARGYTVPCSTVANPGNARFSSRGISAHY